MDCNLYKWNLSGAGGPCAAGRLWAVVICLVFLCAHAGKKEELEAVSQRLLKKESEFLDLSKRIQKNKEQKTNHVFGLFLNSELKKAQELSTEIDALRSLSENLKKELQIQSQKPLKAFPSKIKSTEALVLSPQELNENLTVYHDFKRAVENNILLLKKEMKNEKDINSLNKEISMFVDEESFFNEQGFIVSQGKKDKSSLGVVGLTKKDSSNDPATSTPQADESELGTLESRSNEALDRSRLGAIVKDDLYSSSRKGEQHSFVPNFKNSEEKLLWLQRQVNLHYGMLKTIEDQILLLKNKIQ